LGLATGETGLRETDLIFVGGGGPGEKRYQLQGGGGVMAKKVVCWVRHGKKGSRDLFENFCLSEKGEGQRVWGNGRGRGRNMKEKRSMRVGMIERRRLQGVHGGKGFR